MKTKIIVNKKYNKLEGFISTIPSNFMIQGDIIQARRNVIKTITCQNLNLNIKRYKKPILINRIVYTFLRRPKAYKAYYNALTVVEKGFSTPYPISYIEEFSTGFISLSYFISIQLDNVKEIREFYFSEAKKDKEFLTAFAQYTALLHDSNILHLDYSPGNILFSETNDGYKFSIVDINRMRFCPVNIEMGCKNFSRLFEYDEASIFVAEEYAKARKLDLKVCIDKVLYYKHQFERKKEIKRRLKNLFKK